MAWKMKLKIKEKLMKEMTHTWNKHWKDLKTAEMQKENLKTKIKSLGHI